jgi:uncharacterized flavoprotein (TIGR03862 family)
MPEPQDRRRTATVVGGGPAGLMAAEVMSSAGWVVTVVDHMPSVGRKLLLAGRGGLNITHSEPVDVMLRRYGVAGARLESALLEWGPTELRSWCAGLGEPTFVGSSGRVFPESFRATPLLRAWLARLTAAGVTIESRWRFVGFVDADADADAGKCHGGPVVGAGTRSIVIATPDGERRLSTDVVVLALGGASWPRVGSDGGWVEALERVGVAVAPMRPANCGLTASWRPEFLARHEGAPVKNVSITFGAESVRGDLVVTAAGIEGGPVYALAATARDEIERSGSCTLLIDLQPDLDVDDLAARLRKARSSDSSSTVLRRSAGLSAAGAALVRELGGRELPGEPRRLARLLKALPFTTSATMPIDRAISSAGGIRFEEIDDHFMLRRVPGVFVAGEMIDWEAPTGGYLLQATLSTAVAAARGALQWMSLREAEG